MKTTSRVIWLMDVTYAYDHRGRMVYKTIGTIGLEQDKAISYLWDDYNIIAETVVQGGVTSVTCNVWGLDISDTMQGAGGIGGLLAVIRDGEPFFPCYDANGNITEYLDTNGVIVAHYEYDPFGNIIIQSGSLSAAFTHRFSTKPWCEVTGLSEYVYRKYSPSLGRWLNRDPQEEHGGDNLYGFANNAPLGIVDLLGLTWIINRAGSSHADAKCECDSVEELAKRIGLDVDDYRKWLSPADGGPLPISATEIMKDRKFRIPNIVYATWAGNMGGFGKWWVSWDSSVSYLVDRGFNVIEYDYIDTSNYSLQSALSNAASSRALHGLYFWGHGFVPNPPGTLSSGLSNANGKRLVRYSTITLPYKMALSLIYACYSNDGKWALHSNAPGSVWHGYNGILVPWNPFGWHVHHHINSGDQETK